MKTTGMRIYDVKYSYSFYQSFYEWRPGVGFPKNTTLKNSFFFLKLKQKRFGS